MKPYSRKTQCPICKSKMKFQENPTASSTYYCINNCYKETKWDNLFNYWIDYEVFSEILQINSEKNELEKQEIIESLRAKIRYWRKDNRYLVEMMNI